MGMGIYFVVLLMYDLGHFLNLLLKLSIFWVDADDNVFVSYIEVGFTFCDIGK